jgi:hypothetical protein
MQKILALISVAASFAVLGGGLARPAIAQDVDAAQGAISACLDMDVNLERLICYDTHFGYTLVRDSVDEARISVIAGDRIDRGITRTLRSQATLGEGVAVHFQPRDAAAETLDNEAALLDVFRSRTSLERLQNTADLYMAVSGVEDSPEAGDVAISCIRDITEFWIRWRSPFMETVNEVWIYQSDNVSRVEALRADVEFEPGTRVMGFSRGLPSIELLRQIAGNNGDRFVIEAGSERRMLVIEGTALLEMLRAQRLYCSWR